MFDALKDLFDQFVQPTADTPEQREQQLRLATAVLLVEVMRADPDHDPAERAAVLQALHTRFGLSSEAAAQLVALAERTVESAYDYQHFTQALNAHFTQPQKVSVVQDLWRVAYSDEHLGALENHVISKIAGLLHVTHGEYIAAKLYAREALGVQS